MKMRTKRALLIWIACILLGLLIVVTAPIIPVSSWIIWTVGSLLWITTGVWMGVHFLLVARTGSKRTHCFTGNQAVFDRISRECNQALDRYLSSVKRKGVLQRSALYERPWFLLAGPSQAGKSTLLRGSNLHFPVKYPSERDGMIVEGSNRIMWNFGNDGVWIDTHGMLMEENEKDEWQATIAALAKARRQRPVDGMTIVISAPEILNADPAGINEKAKQLRNRIDELIASWGIEFPVYLVFSRMDEVPGFLDYFSNKMGKWHEQVLGSTLADTQSHMLPRQAFTQEFQLLCLSLSDYRLGILSMEKNTGRRRMVCRFVIHFEGMQEKLADFVAELFKPSNYEGKPIFRGFYFTSCQEIELDDGQGQSQQQPKYEIGDTIANHPLNPNRKNAHHNAGSTFGKSKKMRAFFVAPLFSKIMVSSGSMVKHTQKRSRKEMIRHYATAAALILAALTASATLVSVHNNANNLLKDVGNTISTQTIEDGSIMDAYRYMGRLTKAIEKLQRIENKGVPVSMGMGFYKGDTVLYKLKEEYVTLTKKLIVGPASKYIEFTIRENTSRFGELSADAHKELYSSLKAYLSISEAMSDHYDDIDTAFLRPVLIDGVKKYIMSKQRISRLPADIEASIHLTMGMYLAYLKGQQFPLMQQNQRVVAEARRRLMRLPDAKNLYQTIANRLMQEVPAMTLDDILERSEEGIIKSDQTISMLFTQEGFNQYVSDALNQASQNPFKIDWVIGLDRQQVPASAVEPAKLRDDMIEAYFADYKKQWLSFLGSVHIEQFGNLSRSKRILQKMMADQSELLVLLETVAAHTVVKAEKQLENKGKELLDKASGFKKTKKTATKAKKFSRFAPLGRKEPDSEVTQAFESFRSFVRSTGGVLGGFEGYRDHVMTLVDGIGSIEEQGPDAAISVFNGSEEDPLLQLWKYVNNTLAGMSEDLQQACKPLLLTPVENTGEAVSMVLTQHLNRRWQSEVVDPFTNRLAGQYPFDSRGEEVSFTDVMDFFRPNTGTFWGFYERVLNPYIIKNGNTWSIRDVGSVSIKFEPDIISCLQKAARIKGIFFKNDGTIRPMNITITPQSANRYPATLQVGTRDYKLVPGGSSVHLKWPVPGATQNATLRVHVSSDFTQDIRQPGDWGFMRLLDQARINKLSEATFSAKWQIDVQNINVIFLSYR
ncbi:MAG: type VI secretion system membrane subunit TssM, partial [Fibrobacterota bacterium]